MITYYHIQAENLRTNRSWGVGDFTDEIDAENYLEAYCKGMGYDFICHPDGYVYGELKSKGVRVYIITKNIFESFDESIEALQKDLDDD